MSFSGGAGQIPVEALLKLSLDKAGADTIQKFLDGHEKQWSRVEQSVNRISAGVQEITRFGMGALGVAGIGALAQNFIGSSTAGSNVALAAGHMTGGASAWHPYSQAMLGAQAKTGVPSTQIAQGLILALQSVGGSPSPNQAAILGGLLAGFGQVEGLAPAQVSQIVSPMLQAANKPLTAANLSSMLASTQAVLTATPGSQSGPQLALISSIAQQQAIGGIAPQPVQTAAMLNAAMKSNSLWRDTGVSGGATSSIQSGVQGAYQNPSQEAFMTMAGISYSEQRAGMTPANVTKIMAAATRQYGTGPTRDIMLRSMFGLSGADLLETFSPGSEASKILAAHPHATQAQIRAVQHAAQHPQAGTTPQSWLNKAAGAIFGWAESSPSHAVIAGAGGLLGLKALNAAPGAALKGLGRLLPGAGASAGEDAAVSALGFGLGDVASGGLGALAMMLADPSSISDPKGSPQAGVARALKAAQGHKFASTRAEESFLWNQLGHRNVGQGSKTPVTMAWNLATGFGDHPGGATQAQQLLTKLFNSLGGTNDPITQFSQAVKALQQAANQLKGGGTSTAHGASYQVPGSGGGLGTPAIQVLGSAAPGMEYAALTSGAGGAGSSLFAGLTLGAPGSGASGVTSAPGGAPSGGGSTSPPPGGSSSAQAKQIVAAAASKYGVPFDVLWGVYGAESTFGTAYGPGQQSYGDFGLTSKGLWNPGMSFQQSAQTAAQLLATLYKQKGSWNAALLAYSGNSYGLSHVQGLAGGATAPSTAGGGGGSSSAGASSGGLVPAFASAAMMSGGSASGPIGGGSSSAGASSGGLVPAFASAAMMSGGSASGPIHVHVYIDGKEIRKARVLRGHKP